MPQLQKKHHYKGTLFRLALRSASAAESSSISSDSFSAAKVLQTLQSFITAAPDMLLFTRHVRGITVLVKENSDHACSMLHQCTASTTSLDDLLGCQRQKICICIQDASHKTACKTWIKATHLQANTAKADAAVSMQDTSNTHSSSSRQLPAIDGKVFSTLTLPLAKTFLPVHINGAFMMSSDRRTLRAGAGARAEVKKIDALLCLHDIAWCMVC